MNIKNTLDLLKKEQLESIANRLWIGYEKNESRYSLIHKIHEKIREHTRHHANKEKVTDTDVIIFWIEQMLNLFSKIEVKKELDSDKVHIVNSLKDLLKNSQSISSDALEGICRNILILLYKNLSDQEKKDFVEVLNKDLESHAKKLTKDEFEKILFSRGAIGLTGLPSFLIPVIANMMLQRLTQGFLGWLLIEILGQQAAKKALLGFIAGPIGWTISIALLVGGAGFAIFNYQSTRAKIDQVQAIFSMYSFSYFNRRFGA